MAYAQEADCRLYAPQAPVGVDFAGWVVQSDAVIDSALRSFFTVPLAEVPQLVTNISSKLAVGRYLEASYGAINQEPPEYAGNLISGAMKDLQMIVDDPSILGIDRRDLTVEDLENSRSIVSDDDTCMFDSRNPKDWGK